MESVFRKISGFINSYNKLLVVFSLLLGITSFVTVLKIELKTDMLDVLPAQDPNILKFKEFLADFGSADNLVIAVESEGPVIERIDLVEELAGKLEASGYVEYVDYNALRSAPGLLLKKFPLFLGPEGIEELKERLSPRGMDAQLKKNREAALSPLASPMTMELISKDPLDLGSIALKRLPKKGFSGQSGYYVSKDGHMLLMLAKPKRPARDIKFIEGFSSELDTIVSSLTDGAQGLKIGLTGPYAFAMEAHSSLKKEIITNFITSSVIIILLFQFVYRKRLLVVILTAATLLTALCFTLALAYLLFGGLNMVSSVVTVMLIGMGIDYIIHVFNRWEDEYKESGDPAKALEAAFTRVLPGVATGAVTTSLAFFSIMFTDFKGMYEFGIVAGLGVLSCLLMAVMFMCPAATLLGHRVVTKAPSRGRLKGPASIVLKNRGLVLAIGAVCVVISASFLTGLRFDSDPESIGLKDSPVFALEKKVSETFGTGKNPLIAVVGGGTKDELFERFGLMEDAMKRLEASSVADSHTSLSMFIPSPSAQAEALKALSGFDPAGVKERFLKGLKENGFRAGEYHEKYIERVVGAASVKNMATLEDFEKESDRKARNFYSAEKLKAAGYIFPKADGWDEASIKSVSEEVGKVPGAVLTGAPVMLKTLKGAIIKDSSIASALTFLLITVIVYLQFRNIKWALTLQLSLLCSFILTLGAMSIAGIKFNYINIGAVALIFGIGIDYSIYILQGYLEDRKDVPESISRVWKSVIMCALTTLAGFGSLITMSFEGIASLGGLITLGVTMCLFTSLVLLPAFIVLIDRSKGA